MLGRSSVEDVVSATSRNLRVVFVLIVDVVLVLRFFLYIPLLPFYSQHEFHRTLGTTTFFIVITAYSVCVCVCVCVRERERERELEAWGCRQRIPVYHFVRRGGNELCPSLVPQRLIGCS